MEVALDAGAQDVLTGEDGGIEVICDPYAFETIKTAFQRAGLQADIAEIVMKPLNEVLLSGEEGAKMQKLIDALEDLDDVQEVYTSAVLQ